ncbi:hypothetical protein BJV82DRAFT_710101 [Fennellomyces sp. T-0311]|nr:hypothetical protein BJV82DRAFT_710101 [Fennellomyces sp. T-0311]
MQFNNPEYQLASTYGEPSPFYYVEQQEQPMMAAYEEAVPAKTKRAATTQNANRKRPKRKQVKNACVNCQKACKKCDDGRPCQRCIKLGLTATCTNSPRKERKKGVKRGPYKKRQQQQQESSSSSSSSSPWEYNNTPPLTQQESPLSSSPLSADYGTYAAAESSSPLSPNFSLNWDDQLLGLLPPDIDFSYPLQYEQQPSSIKYDQQPPAIKYDQQPIIKYEQEQQLYYTDEQLCACTPVVNQPASWMMMQPQQQPMQYPQEQPANGFWQSFLSTA